MATPEVPAVADLVAYATLVVIAGALLAIVYRLARRRDSHAAEARAPIRTAERTPVDELTAAFEALRGEQERWLLTIEATAEAVYDYDVRTGSVWIGPGFERILGTGGPVARTIEEYAAFVHPDDVVTTTERLRAALADANVRVFETEFRMIHADGEVRHVRLRGVVQRAADGESLRMVGAIGDRTDEHRLAESRLAAQKLESVGLLAGGIAHDFNNLLTSILANASLAKSRILSPDIARAHLDLVEQGSRQAAELTRQLLAYSGRGRIVVEPISVDRLVQDIVRVLEVSVSRKTELVLSLGAAGSVVDGDLAQLQQVVMNLVTNAADAVSDSNGRVEIRTSIRPVDELEAKRSTHATIEAREYVLVEVIDNGRGMSSETLERIFDPFFTTKATGRGLGLSAILGILRSHQAGLVVESTLASGSRFVVYLPLSETREQRARTTPRFDDRPLVGRVLVVDDEEAIRVAASAVLGDLGLEVVAVEDGHAAIEAVESSDERFDLVLLDLTMPRLDGHSTLQHLRSRIPTLPIVLSSGYSAQEVLARYANDARTSFLPKPWRAVNLVNAVRLALSQVSEGRPTP